jgi:hypothetical protein
MMKYVGDPGPGWHERQVGYPQLIGSVGSEVAADQVRVAGHTLLGSGGADPLGAPHALDPGGAHQPSDLVPADVVSGTLGGLPDLPSAVDPIVVLPQLAHHRSHHGITLGPR